MPREKIAVFKKVYWKHAGQQLSGKVRMIMGDHVLVKSDAGEYVVLKEKLSLNPDRDGIR
jgi:hypothetical protein